MCLRFPRYPFLLVMTRESASVRKAITKAYPLRGLLRIATGSKRCGGEWRGRFGMARRSPSFSGCSRQDADWANGSIGTRRRNHHCRRRTGSARGVRILSNLRSRLYAKREYGLLPACQKRVGQAQRGHHSSCRRSGKEGIATMGSTIRRPCQRRMVRPGQREGFQRLAKINSELIRASADGQSWRGH